MRVVALGLTPANAEALGRVCAAEDVQMELVATGDHVDASRGPILACIEELAPGASPRLSPLEARDLGAYPILVLNEIVPSQILAATEQGYTTYFDSPLRESRVQEYLGYLKNVAPPAISQSMTLDELTLRGPAGAATTLLPAEAKVLEMLAGRAGRIVARTELDAAVPDDATRVVSQLKRKLREAGSHAKILKVPHIGFRFIGTIDT